MAEGGQDIREILQKLQESMEAGFQLSQAQATQKQLEMSQQIKDLKQSVDESLKQSKQEITQIKRDLVEVDNYSQRLGANLAEHQNRVVKMDKRLAIAEQQLRAPNVVIRGIEQEKVDDLKNRVLLWLNSMGLEKKFVSDDLVSVYRIGFRRRDGSIRNVLVKFSNISDKSAVLRRIKEDEDKYLKFEYRRVQVYHDISKEERDWRYKMKPVTRLLRDKDLKYHWRYPQTLRFFYDRRMHQLYIGRDIVEYLDQIGLLTKAEKEDLASQFGRSEGPEGPTSAPDEAGGEKTPASSENESELDEGEKGLDIQKGKRKELELSVEKDAREKRGKTDSNGEDGAGAGIEMNQSVRPKTRGMEAGPSPQMQRSIPRLKPTRRASLKETEIKDNGQKKIWK